MDERFLALEDTLLAYSHGDFTKKLALSDNLDALDSIMSGINMLGEELEETTIKRDFFNSAFHSITDSLVVIDNAGVIIDFNESFIVLTEFKKEDVIIFKIGQVTKLNEIIKKKGKILNRAN